RIGDRLDPEHLQCRDRHHDDDDPEDEVADEIRDLRIRRGSGVRGLLRGHALLALAACCAATSGCGRPPPIESSTTPVALSPSERNFAVSLVRSTAPRAVWMSCLAIFANTKPMKKMKPAPMMLGRNPKIPSSRPCSGVRT